jgi:ABC-2 type transport system permease protein
VRNVVLIAGRELASYVRTPSGYLIAAIMLAWQGLMFNVYALGPGADKSTDVLLRFFEIGGGTTIVTAFIFSMRLLAEDRSNGTQTLLFTSPVREGEIVLGKYFASLIYIIVVVLLSLYLPALILMKGKVSWGHIGAGYLGMILIGASTLALGTFASSLVKHPFFAVLLTGFFVAVLEFGSFLVSRVVEGTLGEVIGFMSGYYGHFSPTFREGLVQLSDVVFFVSMAYFWLLAATHVLKGQRWR